MDIKDLSSSLIMTDFYFSECSIKRKRKIEDGPLKIDVSRKMKVEEGFYHVQVILTVRHESGDIFASVTADADFKIEGEEIANKEKVLQENTVAIMFPFIRSEVTLLTSQPGMMPIVLPTINTKKIV